MEMIYVTMIGKQIAASETKENAVQQIHEMLHGVAKDMIDAAYDNGEFQRSIRIRSVRIPLQR